MRGAELEGRLQSRILAGHLLDEDADTDFRRLYRKLFDDAGPEVESPDRVGENFATYRSAIVVPAGSTQELRAVLSISSLFGQGTELVAKSQYKNRRSKLKVMVQRKPSKNLPN